MWYFAWVLGISMAVLFGIINAISLEFSIKRRENALDKESSGRVD